MLSDINNIINLSKIRITEKRVALTVLSISSLVFYNLLSSMNLIYGITETGLVLISLIIFILSVYYLINDFKLGNVYFKSIFALFIAYEVFIIYRGLSFSYEDIKTYLQSGFVFWPFVIPVLVYFDKSLITLGLLIKWLYYICVFYLIVIFLQPNLLMERKTAESIITLVSFSGFLWLNANYLNSRKTNIVFFVLFISLISLTYLARRNGMVTFSGFILAGYLLNIIKKSKSLVFRLFPVFLVAGLFVLFSFKSITSSLTASLVDRGKEDTRTSLFEMFFFEMNDNLILGKGMNGTYYYPFEGETEVDGVIFGEVEYRNVIENGYLQLMLSGGVIHVVLFLLLCIPAIYNGIFRSSNQFSKACAIFIFLKLIDMLIYGLPMLTVHYILIWISIGICFSSEFAKTKDEDIKDVFRKLGLI
jgi:hypothetical protein